MGFVKSMLALSLGLSAMGVMPAPACTRVMYKGLDSIVLTARSMDWKENIGTDLWIFPRGMRRNGEAGEHSLEWRSKYGSVIASAYNIATADGMNEKGLVANLLWLAESEFPVRDRMRSGLSISLWAQYVLDNFATVSEAVEALAQEPFALVSSYIPNMPDKFATLHLSLSDPTGDNAIFEYIGGRLVIHHDPSYRVMTNSPVFEQQLALNAYWSEIGGTTMLPGTNRAADRFVRASFHSRDGRCAARHGSHIQCYSELFGPSGHLDTRPAEHLFDDLAGCRQSAGSDLLLRVGAESQCFLG